MVTATDLVIERRSTVRGDANAPGIIGTGRPHMPKFRTVLDEWLRLGPMVADLVYGCIRWPKVLGVPDGPLDKAFFVHSHHYDQQRINVEQWKPLDTKHTVELWEGVHDDAYFRVNFVTQSMLPKDWDFAKDPWAKLNHLEVRLHTGVSWSNNLWTGNGGKVFVPAHLTFDPPGKAQWLPDIEVIHLPLSRQVS
jgi:hypothetical protein